MSVTESSNSSPRPAVSGRIRILWAEEPGALPEGFADPGYQPGGEALELGRGGTYRMRWPDGRGVYYRKFRHGGFFGGLLGHRYGSSSRLRREIVDSQRLARAGIRVPRPVLGRCERDLFCYQLAIVTVGVEGQTLFESLVAGVVDVALLRRVGQALAALHETGFQHRDLHPANLIVDPAGEVHILDLEGGGWGGQRSDAHAVASLVRLARYWEKHGPDQALPRMTWILALLGGYEPDPHRRGQLFRRCQERYRSRIVWHRLFWSRPSLA